MKPEDISDAIGMLDDHLIAYAENVRKKHTIEQEIPKKQFRFYAVTITAVFALFCFAASIVFSHFEAKKQARNATATQISKAIYPKKPLYPNNLESGKEEEAYEQYKKWQKEQEKQKQYQAPAKESLKNLTNFFSETMRQLLIKKDTDLSHFFTSTDDKNYVCSPLNLYMALSVLSELCDGNSQKQIFTLLKTDTKKALQVQTNCLWNAEYCNDGVTENILANSLWLNETIPFRQSLMDTLAKTYYVSSYKGTMGSKKFDQMLQDWINKQTNYFLKKETQTISLEKETILALVSTLYFQSGFSTEFSVDATKEAIFHSPYKDITCDFMREDNVQDYYESEHFLAIEKYLKNDQSLWLFLPKEDIKVQELLKDNSVMNLILYKSKIPSLEEAEQEKQQIMQEIKNIKRKTRLIHLSLPKFDISSKFNLKESLQAMGITDVFDRAKADFSPLLSVDTVSNSIYLSKASQTVRLMIDETGVLGSSYVEMELNYTYAGEEPEMEELNLTFDRPFLFVIAGKAETPLFAGIVNNPKKDS